MRRLLPRALPQAGRRRDDRIPGIRELLNKLAEHLPLVIATSKPRALAEPLLDLYTCADSSRR